METTTVITKICTKCKEERPLNLFRQFKIYYENVCKDCTKMRQKELRSTEKAKQRRKELRNTEESKRKAREYAAKEEVKNRAKAYAETEKYKTRIALYNTSEKRKELQRNHKNLPHSIETRKIYLASKQFKETYKNYTSSENYKLSRSISKEKAKESERYAISHLSKLTNFDKNFIEKFPDIIKLKQLQLKTHRLCRQLKQ